MACSKLVWWCNPLRRPFVLPHANCWCEVPKGGSTDSRDMVVPYNTTIQHSTKYNYVKALRNWVQSHACANASTMQTSPMRYTSRPNFDESEAGTHLMEFLSQTALRHLPYSLYSVGHESIRPLTGLERDHSPPIKSCWRISAVLILHPPSENGGKLSSEPQRSRFDCASAGDQPAPLRGWPPQPLRPLSTAARPSRSTASLLPHCSARPLSGEPVGPCASDAMRAAVLARRKRPHRSTTLKWGWVTSLRFSCPFLTLFCFQRPVENPVPCPPYVASTGFGEISSLWWSDSHDTARLTCWRTSARRCWGRVLWTRAATRAARVTRLPLRRRCWRW